MIYSGQMKREEALKELEQDVCSPDMVQEDRGYVIKKWRISEEEFESIMEEPPKSYKVYPNQERLMKLYKLILYNVVVPIKRNIFKVS